MEQVGIITKIDGNYAYVNIERKSACGENCASCGGCGNAVNTIRVINKNGTTVGDIVTVQMSSKRLLLATFLLYVFPLLSSLFLGMLLSILFNDNIAVISAIVWFFLVYLTIYLLNSKIQKREWFIGKIM